MRADVDGMLDVARHTFLQSTDDIYQTADQMSQEAGYHVKVRRGAIRAFFVKNMFVLRGIWSVHMCRRKEKVLPRHPPAPA